MLARDQTPRLRQLSGDSASSSTSSSSASEAAGEAYDDDHGTGQQDDSDLLGSPSTSSSISKELLEREKHYRKLNNELRAKSAQVVKRTENAVKEGMQTFDGKIPLGRPMTAPSLSSGYGVRPKIDAIAATEAVKSASARPATGSKASLRTVKRPGEAGSAGGSGSAAKKALSIPEAELIQKIAAKVQASGDFKDATTEEIGLEATNRYLKARLAVLEEELDRVIQSSGQQSKSADTSQGSFSALRAESAKLTKQNQTLNDQIAKLKKQSADQAKHTAHVEAQLASLKKELSSTQQDKKQSSSDITHRDARLNRALEDVDKLKAQLAKEQAGGKEQLDTHRKTIERLTSEIKRQERQKSELLTGFKKQLQLIDVLKKQKVHLEVAKLLAFTEEEFMKALSWEA